MHKKLNLTLLKGMRPLRINLIWDIGGKRVKGNYRESKSTKMISLYLVAMWRRNWTRALLVAAERESISRSKFFFFLLARYFSFN